MTKTLTEQWKDGTLPDGYYYVISKWSGKIEINDYFEGCWQDLKEEYIKEVLAPVPSYDEYKHLQEQIKEAQNLIIYCSSGDHLGYQVFCEQYMHKYHLSKWGVK